MPGKMLLIACLLCALALPAAAQVDTTAPTPIAYGESVQGQLNADNFFALWTFDAQADDQIVIRMAAADGLQPQIGLLDPSANLVASTPDAEADTAITLEASIPADGSYTIVATRVGRDQGSSAGSYTLSLALAGADAPPATTGVQEVTFRCGADEIATAATLELGGALASEGAPYRLNVYGLEGFQTYVRITSPVGDLNYCTRGSGETESDIVLLPDEAPRIFDADMLANTFELELEDPSLLGTLTITIGSLDAAPGRYVAVLTGLFIDAPGQHDLLSAFVGPLAAAEGEVLVYALALDVVNSRLDPALRLLPSEVGCDDAGRRGCEDIPSFVGAGLRLADEFSILGDRFDAGVRLRQGDLEEQIVENGSFAGNTSGAYALVVVGSLPAR